MLKAFIHIKVTEQHKYNSNMNYKIYPRKKQIFIVFMEKKILLKFHLKQMCQMLFCIIMNMPMELVLFKKSGMKFHCLQGLYQTMSFKDITLKEIEKKPVFQEHRSITIFRQKRKYFLHF